MKVITEKATGLANFIYADDVTLMVNADMIIAGDPAELYISDFNETNAAITENVTNVPSDWAPDKYTFDGTTWTLNADYAAPVAPYVIGD